ncbi:MAG: glycosyltransferase, partial [Chloroflexi bacterium]|nr:glycosyltransferase [Chloroflexota bacterium]
MSDGRAIVCIDLHGASRWTSMREQCSRAGVVVRRLRSLELSTEDSNPLGLSPGQTRSLKSHLALLHWASARGLKELIVLEDDILLAEDFMSRLEAVRQWTPPEAPLCFLSAIFWWPVHLPVGSQQRVWEFRRPTGGVPSGAHAYYVRQEGFGPLIEALSTSGLPPEHAFEIAVQRGLGYCVAVPMLATAPLATAGQPSVSRESVGLIAAERALRLAPHFRERLGGAALPSATPSPAQPDLALTSEGAEIDACHAPDASHAPGTPPGEGAGPSVPARRSRPARSVAACPGSLARRDFSVVIPSATAANLIACVEAIFQHEPTLSRDRIIIVDDGARPGAEAPLPGIRWIMGIKPFVFARNVNLGIRAAGTDVILLNDDAQLRTPNGFSGLSQLVGSRPSIGVCSPGIGGIRGFPRQQPTARPELLVEPRRLAFTCVYIPRLAIDRVGLLDERFTAYGFEDNDYSLRVLRAGLELRVWTGCVVDHASLTPTFRSRPDQRQLFREGRQ